MTRMKHGFKRRLDWWRARSRKQKALIIATPLLIFLIVVPIATYFYYARDISNQERLMNRNNTGVVFYDKNDEVFYSIGRSKQQELVSLDDMSQDLKDAVIASEDKDFYNHNGFSVLSIGRALFTNLSNGDLTAYGGSTLTQQLAKNTLLTQNKSFMRKYQELAVSIAIEQNYSKDEILTMYLNSVYFGENAFGISDAARTYFDKTPAELDLAESAMLIGLLPAPSAYSPINGSRDAAVERQGIVLERMERNGYITAEEREDATDTKLTYARQSQQANPAPHFTEMVLEELSEQYGYEQVMRSGYQVKTTLNLEMQKSLNANLRANMPFIEANSGSNASAVAIDPTNGEIRALVGSADYGNEEWGKVNMVTTARQPGSTFKSLYYAGALAEGIVTPASVLSDRPININGWQPQNADRTFRGDVTLRESISQSLNIPSIEVMQKYGVDKSIEQAEALGVSSLDPAADYGLSLAIGSAEVPLLEMTNAYATLANQGERHDTSMILSIRDKFDKTIYTAPRANTERAISQAGAFLISDILSDNAARAPIFGSSLTVPNKTVAVKTGTTDENRDAWTIGYTPSLTIGVWVGNNDNSVMFNGGSGMAGPIWRGAMSDILADRPDEQFSAPASVVERRTCFSNHGLATNNISEGTYREYYLSTALPTLTCTPEEPKIEVCETATGEVIEINEDDFDREIHSRNTNKCEPPPDEEEEPEVTEIQVCETETGEIITITEEEFDESIHSRDLENCSAPSQEETGPPPASSRLPTAQ